VVAVGSHDTASAVAAVPAQEENFAYISSGTWSLVGLELKHPVLTEASREANFTNERGVDGTIRYLRNMGGLWLLSECQRTWAQEGFRPDITALLGAAAALPPGGPQVNADDPYFIAPDNMPERIRAAVRRTGDVLPNDPAAITRCIMDSLAAGYARTIRDAERLADLAVDVVHVVGGGSQNACSASSPPMPPAVRSSPARGSNGTWQCPHPGAGGRGRGRRFAGTPPDHRRRSEPAPVRAPGPGRQHHSRRQKLN
jgi:rhamnulokinase